jgi:hypothetical protein
MSSTYLVASPSFLTGVARTLDLYGQFDAYNGSKTAQEADALALQSDWKVVGEDLRAAVKAQRRTPAPKRPARND